MKSRKWAISTFFPTDFLAKERLLEVKPKEKAEYDKFTDRLALIRPG